MRTRGWEDRGFCDHSCNHDTLNFRTEMDQVVEVAKGEHEKLKGRDRPDQHPISAITDLKTQLDQKYSVGERITNTDIMNILSM